jgi:hypothetical protein
VEPRLGGDPVDTRDVLAVAVPHDVVTVTVTVTFALPDR